MSESFKKATEDSKKLTSKPSTDDLLELYGKDLLASNLRFSTNWISKLSTRSPTVMTSLLPPPLACSISRQALFS